MKVLCSYSWMLCKHNSSGGNSREANSFLTSCQRVGGYGVASGWCPLSTTRSGHFQLDVPFIFVKWIYNIKSGPRWKWISRMHQISFLCWNGDDVGEFRRLSRWSEPETVSSSGDNVCTWSTVCKFPSLPNFLLLQQALHCTCFMNLWASVCMKGFRNNLSAYIWFGDSTNRFQFWTTPSRSQTQRMNPTPPPFLCKCLAVMFNSGLGFRVQLAWCLCS